MFNRIPQPLRYAESLLGHYTELSHAASVPNLLEYLVRAAARLSGCELAQLYLLDATHASLGLSAECLHDCLQPLEANSLPSDYKDQQLLQYSLCQNRVLCLPELNPSLHETAFLPAGSRPWRTLLCLPLLDRQQTVQGLLLCASHEEHELGGFADSLALLGSFALSQLQLLQRTRLPREMHDGQVAVSRPSASGYGLIGESPAMRQTYRLIGKVLHSPYTVLLNGETGTGKELVARAIHDCGPRRSGAFIVQNCSSLPEHLLESELFGYRKGAFTGAERDRTGLFDAADGGTLFLDEIGDMPLSLQAKLLRVLQEGEVRPLGTTLTHRIDVRIIAATHRDLRAMIAAGEFREDLYYRLAQFPIELPALRQRGEDILQLARHFADKACDFLQRPACSWSAAALQCLSTYDFPGNVRELKGMVERAILLCECGELQPAHFSLPDAGPAAERSLGLRERLEQVERTLLLDCLRKNGGNRTLAARELGLPRRTLLYRLSRLNIHAAEA